MSSNISDDVCNSSLVALRTTDIIAQTVIFSIGLPAVSLACYAIVRLAMVDHTTPVYVINLLVADLLQVLVRPFLIKHAVETEAHIHLASSEFLFVLGQFGSIGFMLCITVERYVAVACPLWYQQSHLKRSVLTCLAIWIFILMISLFKYFFIPEQLYFEVVLSFVLFICVVMCYCGTLHAIRSVRSVSEVEKKRITHLLAMVVGTYGVLFLPLAFLSIYSYIVKQDFCILKYFVCLLVQLTPLVDPFLYIFVRRDVSVQNNCCTTL